MVFEQSENNELKICTHICGCKAKLRTLGSQQRKKCSDCLLGNCRISATIPD